MGLNLERPPDLVTLFRHRVRPVVHCTHSNSTVEKRAQVHESTNDAHSETSNCVQNFHNSSVATALPQEPNSLETLTHTSDSSINDRKEANSKSMGSPCADVLPSSIVNSDPLIQSSNSTNLQHSARALKEELQHSVEDVRQKLHSFFSKSH